MPRRRLLILAALALLPPALPLHAAQPAGLGTSVDDAPARFTVSDETLQFRGNADRRFSVHAEVHSMLPEATADVRFRLHATSNDKAACSIAGAALFADGFES